MKKLPYILTLTAALSLGFVTVACSDDGGTEAGDTEDETTGGDGDGDAGDGDGDPATTEDTEDTTTEDTEDTADTEDTEDTDTTDTEDTDTTDTEDTDTTDTEDTDTGEPPECVDVEVSGWGIDDNGSLFIEDIMIGDPALADNLRVEFYTDVAPGMVDLGSDAENNYQVCLHCVRVFEDIDGMDIARQYFQAAGTLDITEVGENVGEMAATHTGVQLIEVTVAEDFLSTPVPNGQCINLVDGEINTLP